MKTAPRLGYLVASIKRQWPYQLWSNSSDSESNEDEITIDFESCANKVGNLKTTQSMNRSSAESGEKMSNKEGRDKIKIKRLEAVIKAEKEGRDAEKKRHEAENIRHEAEKKRHEAENNRHEAEKNMHKAEKKRLVGAIQASKKQHETSIKALEEKWKATAECDGSGKTRVEEKSAHHPI